MLHQTSLFCLVDRREKQNLNVSFNCVVSWFTDQLGVIFFSFFLHVWVCMTRSILLCECFLFNEKGTYWSTNQLLHIRVTINCVFVFVFLIDNTNCFNFFLLFLNVAHKKIGFLSIFPQCVCVNDFHFVLFLTAK